MRRLPLLFAACLVLSSPSIAAAECAMSVPFVAPGPSTPLPPNPTLWVFSPSSQYVDASVSASVPLEAGPVEVFGGLQVQRVRLSVVRGAFTLRVGDAAHERRVAATQTTYEETPRVGPFVAVQDAWTCSFTDELVAPVAARAPVFEVEWAGGRTVIPAHAERFWGDSEQPPHLHLGHMSCFGYTVPGARRPGLDGIRVTALYPDGSTRPAEVLAPLATEITTTPAPLASAQAAPAVLSEPPPADRGLEWWMLGLGASLLALCGLVVLARRRSARSTIA